MGPLNAGEDKPHLPLYAQEEQGTKEAWIPFVSPVILRVLPAPPQKKGLLTRMVGLALPEVQKYWVAPRPPVDSPPGMLSHMPVKSQDTLRLTNEGGHHRL